MSTAFFDKVSTDYTNPTTTLNTKSCRTTTPSFVSCPSCNRIECANVHHDVSGLCHATVKCPDCKTVEMCKLTGVNRILCDIMDRVFSCYRTRALMLKLKEEKSSNVATVTWVLNAAKSMKMKAKALKAVEAAKSEVSKAAEAVEASISSMKQLVNAIISERKKFDDATDPYVKLCRDLYDIAFQESFISQYARNSPAKQMKCMRRAVNRLESMLMSELKDSDPNIRARAFDTFMRVLNSSVINIPEETTPLLVPTSD